MAEAVIPPVTDPLGRHWDQPSRSLILLDDVHAVMSTETFYRLCDYSGSMPSGVYAGKMWRRCDGIYDRVFRGAGGRPVWLLCWYSPSDRLGFFVIKRRIVLLSDADVEALSC